MKEIDDATMQERLEHFTRHLRARVALSAKMSAGLITGEALHECEEMRRATLQGVVEHLSDLLDGSEPRYTTATTLE